MVKNHKENGECKKSFTVSKLFNESKKSFTVSKLFNESKKSFTKNRVYKSQTNKYILLVKIKELNELEQSLKQRNQ